MGCFVSGGLEPIPLPTGPAKNPLECEGDVVENILTDPHIHYFQQKIEEVLLPLRRRKVKKDENGLIKGGSESYATTDKR